jgi:hypothetical protein
MIQRPASGTFDLELCKPTHTGEKSFAVTASEFFQHLQIPFCKVYGSNFAHKKTPHGGEALYCQSITRKIDRMDKYSLTFSLIAMAFFYAAQLSIKPSASSSSWADVRASFTRSSNAFRIEERHR